MAIGNFYPISPTVVDQDLFLGTKLGGNNTVNYTGQTVANYLSTKITIGGQVSFIFDTTPGIPKTISFSGGGGNNTPFSSITQLIVSSIDALGANVTVFLNYINGSEILLSERTEPNIFGHYKIVGYTVTANPAFYTLNLQFIGGNGAITNGVYYNLSSFVLSSSLGAPTLNQVLTAGNTSIIDAKVGNLYSYDNVNAGYGIVQFYDSGVALKGASTNNLLFYNDDTGTVKFSNGTYAPTLNFAGVGNNVYTFQNANGTLAFLSDIPSLSGYVPYTGATGPVNLGAFNLLVNGVSVGIGAGSITSNTAMGNLALSSNTTGTFNSAFGSQSMLSNTEGRYNSAYGHQSLQNNTIGQYNTAVGLGSLFNNTSALYNTACGFQALLLTTTGGENSAYGRGSLRNNTTGIQNVGLGAFSSLLNATDSNCIVIGYNATGAGSNTVTLGNTSIVTTILRGSVGIGTTAPSQNLHVSGNARITGAIYDSTNSPGTAGQFLASTVTGTDWVNAGTVTSIGMTVPSAFNVTPSTITSSGTFAITGAGAASQYVRGDGTLANFPTSTGGGASVSYYLNGSISQGTIGGVAYKEMNSVPVIGTGTDFTINADGYIAQFITDAGDPNKLLIPGGNWNFETYFSASSGGGSPSFYIELYKYDGTTFTLIASNSTSPENITGGTSIDLYFSALAVPPTTLTVTDRLAVRFYVIHSGRTITMHTENSHLSQVITTFSSGLTALNGLTSQVQYFAVGTSGTDFNISSATDTHTFNLPTASAANRGALSSADWTAFNSKFNLPSLTSGSVLFSNGTTIAQDNAQLFWDDTNNRLGIGTASPAAKLHINNASTAATNFLAGNVNGGAYFGWDSDNTGLISTYTNAPIKFGGNYASSFNEWMRINSSGNVGIGTTSPNSYSNLKTLTINGTNGSVIDFTANGVLYGEIYAQANDFRIDAIGSSGVLKLLTNSAERMRITSSGSVGIGTTTPGTINSVAFSGVGLQVTSGSLGRGILEGSSQAELLLNDSGATANQRIKAITSDGGKIFLGAYDDNGTSRKQVTIDDSGNVGVGTTFPLARLQVRAPGALSTDIALRVKDSADSADFMVVNGLGNVGIGTTNPTQKLQVNGNGLFGVAKIGNWAINPDFARFGHASYDGATNFGFLQYSNGETYIEGATNNFYATTSNIFSTASIERMRITAAGNVGIGTTSPSDKLTVQGTIAVAGNGVIGQGSIYGTPGNSSYGTIHLYNGATGNTIINNQSYGIDLHTAGSSKMYITQAGDVGIGTTNPDVKFQVQGGTIKATTSDYAFPSTGGAISMFQDNNDYGTIWSVKNYNGAWGNIAIAPLGGNVGIGLNNPSSLLEIAGPAPVLTMNRTSGSFTNTIDFKTGGSSVGSILSNAGNGEQRYSIGPSAGWGGYHTFYTDTSERMRIATNGNVGIGTSSPGAKLDVNLGNINLSNAYYLSSRNNANTANITLIGRDTSDRVIIDADGYGTTIGGGGSVLINPTSGNVGIGTSSPAASARLDINSTTQGFLPPRMTNAQRTSISLPAVGLMVYCTDATEGLYIYKSTGWTFII